ncbi:MAG: GerMN domain-containing protein [Clostridia bacterium]|nr:GerMN domain-containing protein [Clostridia bacterium]
MKFLNDQRRLYFLSACLLALTVLLCLTWQFLRGGNDAAAPAATASPRPQEAGSPGPEPSASPQPVSSAENAAQTVATIVYYQDNSGYIVPVMKQIAPQEGIARATLSLMVSSPHNDMEAARLGLRTVLPEGTDIDLDISGGIARVNLSGTVDTLPDAAAESNMVSAVVQALTEFDTVETVRFLINGREVETLSHGTPVSGDFTRGMINLESVSADFPIGDAKPVTLYFAGETGSLIVPVTRMVYGNADLNTAVLELLKGPGDTSPLESALPVGCGLISVDLDGDGKASINLTDEFMNLIDATDGGRQALRALALTCAQFPGVTGVEVLVDGTPYDAAEATLALPRFVNDAESVADQFLQAQARLLFGPDE